MIYTFGGMAYSKYKLNFALNFSKALTRRNDKRVLFIDGSSSHLAQKIIAEDLSLRQTELLSLVTIDNDGVLERLAEFKTEYDDIVINSSIGSHLEEVLQFSDRLLVPFDSSDLALWNMWKLTNLERVIDDVWEYNPLLTARAFAVNEENECKIFKDFISKLRKSQYLTFIETNLIGEDQLDVKELEHLD